MSPIRIIPSAIRLRPACLSLLLLAAGGTAARAADNDLRIVPQVAVGTSGFEPGLAFEWRGSAMAPWIIRPEVLISEDGRPGVGGAILYDFSSDVNLPDNQALAIGPRVVYHNSDDSGLEADALVTWSWDLARGLHPWRHAIGALGALGVYHDKEHDEADVGVTGGFFYSFRF